MENVAERTAPLATASGLAVDVPWRLWESACGSQRFRIPKAAALPRGEFPIRDAGGTIRSVDESFVRQFALQPDAKEDDNSALEGRLKEWEDVLGRLSQAGGHAKLLDVLTALGGVLVDGTHTDPGRRAATPDRLQELHGLLSGLGIDIGDELQDLPKRLSALREQYDAGGNAEKLADRMDGLASDIAGATPDFARVLTDAAAKLRGAASGKGRED